VQSGNNNLNFLNRALAFWLQRKILLFGNLVQSKKNNQHVFVLLQSEQVFQLLLPVDKDFFVFRVLHPNQEQ